MAENPAILIGLAVLVLANSAVNVAIARSGYYERKQILAQAAMIWLLPVVGAVITGWFLLMQRATPEFGTRSEPDYEEKTDRCGIGGSSHTPSAED